MFDQLTYLPAFPPGRPPAPLTLLFAVSGPVAGVWTAGLVSIDGKTTSASVSATGASRRSAVLACGDLAASGGTLDK